MSVQNVKLCSNTILFIEVKLFRCTHFCQRSRKCFNIYSKNGDLKILEIFGMRFQYLTRQKTIPITRLHRELVNIANQQGNGLGYKEDDAKLDA